MRDPLEVLDVSCNRLSALSGLAGLVALKQLFASYNRIRSLYPREGQSARRRRRIEEATVDYQCG